MQSYNNALQLTSQYAVSFRFATLYIACQLNREGQVLIRGFNKPSCYILSKSYLPFRVCPS